MQGVRCAMRVQAGHFGFTSTSPLTGAHLTGALSSARQGPVFVEAGWFAAQIALAATIGAAGASKRCEGGASSEGVSLLGVPAEIATGFRWALPCAGLLIGGLLAWQPTARVGAVLAAGLVCVFTALVAAALVTGRKAGCSCFGTAARRSVGRGNLIRNGALLAAAVLVFVVPPSAAQPTAAAAPGAMASALLRAGLTCRRVGAVFVDRLYRPCQRLLAGAHDWRYALGSTAAVVLVGQMGLAADLPPGAVVDAIVPDQDGGLAAEFGIPGTPAAVLLDGAGAPVGAPALGLEAVRALLDRLAVVPPAGRPLPVPPARQASTLDMAGGARADLATRGQLPAADPDGRWTGVAHGQVAEACAIQRQAWPRRAAHCWT